MSSWIRYYYDGVAKTETKYVRRYEGVVRDIETGECFPFVWRAKGKREMFERFKEPFTMRMDDGKLRMVKLVKNSFHWNE